MKLSQKAKKIILWILSRNYYISKTIYILCVPIYVICEVIQAIINAIREILSYNPSYTRKNFEKIQNQYQRMVENENKKRANQ